MARRSEKTLPTPLAATGTTTLNREVIGDEYVRDLQNIDARMRIYTRMRRGDGAVNTSLLAIEKPILGGRWEVAGDDEIAEACSDELFSTDRGAHFDPPLLEQAVEHLLGMFQYGFAACEPFWEIGEDGRVHCSHLTLIRQESVRTFRLDETARLKELVQYTSALDSSLREIAVPVEQLLMAVHAREGSDYSGVAIIRSSYRSFIERDTIRKTRLWHHDRFGAGTPVAMYPEGATDDQKGETDSALENFRAGARTYIALPFGSNVTLVGGQTGYDPTNELSALASEIAKNTLSQLTELGTSGNTGNRALGDSFADVLRNSLQGYAERIAAVIRRQLMTPFVKWNFGDTAEVPELTVRVTLGGVAELLAAIQMAVTAGMKLEPEDIASLRDELELPEIDADELKRRIDERSVLAAAAQPKPDEKTPPQLKLVPGGKKLSEPGDVATDYLGRLRPAKVVALEEQFVKPRLLKDQLDREAVRAAADVHDVLKEIDVALVSQVRDLAQQGAGVLVSRVGSITVPTKLANRLKKAIAGAAARANDIGRDSVRAELERQGLNLANASITRRTSLMERLFAPLVALADPDLYGGLAAFLKKLIELSAEQEISARELGARSSAMAAASGAATEAAAGAGATTIDYLALARRVQSDLEERSISAVENRVTQVLNVSFGQGRAETGSLFGQAIESQIRTAVLDGNTCQHCAEHDGDEFNFGDRAAPDLPDPDCDGRWACRCFYFFQLARRAA